ncbi:RTA1 like protein-domain-containing protein [Flammula alnicola]|nr:RTA1 like protein-domain-containing protein [Flammula alnicola]
MSGNNGTVDPTSQYGYIPSRSAALIFLSLFAISTLVHSAQAVRYRLWFIFPTAVLCGVIEILGWSGRLWSSFSPIASTPFEIEITCTIIAPTPLLAANFVIFGRLIRRLGAGYSRLSPRLYTIIFTTCDVVSLVVQGLGGGLAATASDFAGANRGANIMLGGIVFQLIVIIAYAICAIEYFVRYHKHAPVSYGIKIRDDKSAASNDAVRGTFTPKLRLMSYGLLFSTTCLFIRAVYRIIELAGGWNGRVIHTQVYFNVLDGAMVILAIYTANFLHPGILLAQTEDETRSNSFSMPLQTMEGA